MFSKQTAEEALRGGLQKSRNFDISGLNLDSPNLALFTFRENFWSARLCHYSIIFHIFPNSFEL